MNDGGQLADRAGFRVVFVSGILVWSCALGWAPPAPGTVGTIADRWSYWALYASP